MHSVPERETIDVPTPAGGWRAPWPNVAEIERVLPHTKWTLIGGLMTQLHGVNRGIGSLRPTADIDMALHVETTRGVAAEATHALETLGYRLTPPLDDRRGTAHRFTRGRAVVDLVGSDSDIVDVLVADHAAPTVLESLRGTRMVAVEGGTQALRRTVNARLEIEPGQVTTVSVPSAFGALILKAAAYQSDSRDRDRHLQDAALLLAAIDDPRAVRQDFAGSDRSRLLTLARALPDDARAWRSLADPWRTDGQTALRILLA